ncbi:MAG: Na+/proline symporter [Aureispira sp.]|jgi:Na+/proline symporter
MIVYIFIGIYVVLIIAISYFYSKNGSDEDYLISGRDRNEWNILASKFAGAVGVSTFITYTSYTYKFGPWGVLPLILGAMVGYSVFAFWAAPKIKQFSTIGNQFYTQGDLVRFITNNNNTRLLTNSITICIQFFWILLSLVGGAKVIAYFDLLSYETALIFTAVIVLLYILFSGFKAVIITDVFQTIIILILLVIIVYNVLSNDSFSIPELIAAQPLEPIKTKDIIGLMLYGGLSVFGLADRYQLCYAAKDANAAKRGMGFALIPIVIVVLLLMFVGLSALKQNNALDYDNAFIYAMQNLLSPSFYPVLLVLFFAGLMSSADTNIFAVASHASFSFAPDSPNKVKTTRWITVIVVVLATSIAFFWQSIVDITIVGAAMRITIAIPMIYIISRGNNTGRFIASSLGGVTALAIGLILYGTSPSIVILVLLGSILGLFYKSKNDTLFWG